ncbi:MAG: DUF4157 domain-containing protein [Williamsia sp.]|nr:DUF4157 domain-containing protein [Williamsia sp.]
MKGTHNPLQMRISAQNPLRPRTSTQNPLKPMISSQNPLKPMTTWQNPLQLLAKQSAPGNNLLQMYAGPDDQREPVQKKPNNTGLPDKLKEVVENLSGFSMDDVKVHYNSNKPAQLRALAYAQGTDIHIGPGQEQHLPHEAWHVVQQKQGKVYPTMQIKGGVSMNDDKGLEKEANLFGINSFRTLTKPMVMKNYAKGMETDSNPGENNKIDHPLHLKSSQNKTVVQQKKINLKVLQRKSGRLSEVNDVIKQASKGAFKTGVYGSVVSALSQYHDNSIIPDNDYGKQIFQLERMYANIKEWENKHGTTDKIIKPGFLGLSKEDKRRKVLDDLKHQIQDEDFLVRKQGYEYASARHYNDRELLKKIIEEGLSQKNDRLLRNSCAWIRAGKTRLYATIPTGDSYARLIKGKKDPYKDEAFFPAGIIGGPGDIYSSQVKYNKDELLDNTNVTFTKSKNTLGWNDPGNPGVVAIVTPGEQSKNKVWSTLKHEVQHDADKHKNRDALSDYNKAAQNADIVFGNPDFMNYADPILGEQAKKNLLSQFGDEQKINLNYFKGVAGVSAADAEISLSLYKTEFRAYSYQEGDTFSELDDTKQDQLHEKHWFSEKQLAIFKHIYRGYKHTADAWNKNPVLADGKTTFREAVAYYWKPEKESFNRYNSVGVDDFYNALDVLGSKKAQTILALQHRLDVAPVDVKESNIESPKVEALLKILDKLDSSDLEYIFYESPVMFSKIIAHLKGEALKAVFEKMPKNQP